jgi:hypothetical protein
LCKLEFLAERGETTDGALDSRLRLVTGLSLRTLISICTKGI